MESVKVAEAKRRRAVNGARVAMRKERQRNGKPEKENVSVM